MGLDKKPSPPRREVQEGCEEKPLGSWKGVVHSEASGSSADQKSSKESVLVILPSHEADVETVEDKVETRQDDRREEGTKLSKCETEDSQEDTGKNEYNEDFEADDVNEKEQAGDQRNEMSKSSPDDEKHNLDYEKKSKNASQKALQASDSEKDESERYSGSTSENGKQDRSSARSLLSTSSQYSSEGDSDTEKMNGNVKGKEECDIKEASDNTACAQYGNENGENKLFRTEDSQETSSLEEEGMDEAEKTKAETLTSRENTEAFNENITAIQHRSPDVTREIKWAGSVGSNIRGEEEKKAYKVPLENNMMEVEDREEESPQSDEGGVSEDDRSAQEEITEAMGNDHHVNFDHECSDSWVDEKAEKATSAECDPSKACMTSQLQQPHVIDVLSAVTVTLAAADGAVLADGTGAPSMESAAMDVAHMGQDCEEDEGHAAERGLAGTDCAEHRVVWAGQLQPEGESVAVAPEGHLLVDGSAPTKGAMAEGNAEEKEPGKGLEPGAEAEDQDISTDAGENMGPWRDPAGEGEEQAGMGAPLGVGRAREVTGGEMAVNGASVEQRVGGAAVPMLGGMVPEGQEAAVWAAENAASEGQKTVEEPGALLGMLGDTEFCTGKEESLNPRDFSQLNVSREEQVEIDALGTATFEPGSPPVEEGSSQPKAEDREEPKDSGRGAGLHTAPGREAGVGAGRSPPLEQTATAGDEEDSAIVLLNGSLSSGSAAKTDRAMEEKSVGVVIGVSGERARAESGDEELRGGAAGPREQATVGQGMLEWGGEQAVLGEGRPPGQGVMGCETLEVAQGPQDRGCLELWGQQPAMPASEAAEEGTVPAGVHTEGKLTELGLGESTQRKEVEALSEGAAGSSGAQEQRTGSPEHSRSEDVNLDAVVTPQDKEETIL